MVSETVFACRCCGTPYELPRGKSMETLQPGMVLTCFDCLATVLVHQHGQHGLAIRGLTPGEWTMLRQLDPLMHGQLMAAVKEKHGGSLREAGTREFGLLIPPE